MKPHQIISLMTFPGTDNTLAAGRPRRPHPRRLPPALRRRTRKAASRSTRSLKPKQWIKLIDRLGQIDNPTVRRQPSQYAVKAGKRAQPGPQGRVATPPYVRLRPVGVPRAARSRARALRRAPLRGRRRPSRSWSSTGSRRRGGRASAAPPRARRRARRRAGRGHPRDGDRRRAAARTRRAPRPGSPRPPGPARRPCAGEALRGAQPRARTRTGSPLADPLGGRCRPPARALVTRVGYGTGEEVAEGEWEAARDLPPRRRA